MSKEMERQSLELREDDSMGSVKIADDVVAMIAALAATEVEGVSSMVGNITHELMNKMGYKNIARGVKVEVFNKKVKVDISVNIEYGYNIPTTGRNIQTISVGFRPVKLQLSVYFKKMEMGTDLHRPVAGMSHQKRSGLFSLI